MERPILFNGEEVRAVLAGRKTQVRRPVKPQPVGDFHGTKEEVRDGTGRKLESPYGYPGDQLWMQEAWIQVQNDKGLVQKAVYRADSCDSTGAYWYSVAEDPGDVKWIASSEMPRELSRITLEITDVRVERLRDITEEDAQAEGARRVTPAVHLDGTTTLVEVNGCGSWIEDFSYSWDSVYADKGFGWKEKPWIWVITFKRLK